MDPCSIESYIQMGFSAKTAKDMIELYGDFLPCQSPIYWARMWIESFEPLSDRVIPDELNIIDNYNKQKYPQQVPDKPSC